MAAQAAQQDALVVCDWSAHCILLCADGGTGRTSWCFLAEIEQRTFVPPKICEFALETTTTIDQTRLKARRTLRNGVLGEYQQMLDAITGLEVQRARIMDRMESAKPRPRKLREDWQRNQRRRTLAAEAALADLAETAAKSLQRANYAVIDSFLPSADGVGAMLRAMHASGDLQPGQVAKGLSTSQRSDLMSWVPASDTLQRSHPALTILLDKLDRLLLALARRPEVEGDLGKQTPLMRAEAQCTCYPGSGSRYVRHTDDARHKQRKLTCIFYANPGWHAQAGGQLRLHLSTALKGGGGGGDPEGGGGGGPLPSSSSQRRAVADVDIDPLDSRLVLFWSDARVPHEVLPTHEPRYAVSVWYHDANRMRATAESSTDAESMSAADLLAAMEGRGGRG